MFYTWHYDPSPIQSEKAPTDLEKKLSSPTLQVIPKGDGCYKVYSEGVDITKALAQELEFQYNPNKELQIYSEGGDLIREIKTYKLNKGI